MGDQEPRYVPRVGEAVKDTQRNTVGRVMGMVGTYVQLRPLAGGLEWDANPECIEPLDQAERLRSSLAEVNAQSRGGLPR